MGDVLQSGLEPAGGSDVLWKDERVDRTLELAVLEPAFAVHDQMDLGR
jgi:hypothetical protein